MPGHDPEYFPGADRTSQFYGPGNYRMPRITKGLFHTTETAGGWPGYAGGGSAPNMTSNPLTKRSRAHFPAHGSARALVDPSSTAIRENRDDVFQTEVTAYCDPRYSGSRYYVGNINKNRNGELDYIAAIVAWLHETHSVPYRLAAMLPYPASYGNSRVRMTGPQYDGFTGFLGHQNASGNDHGDPGALDLAGAIKIARGGNTALPTPTQKKDWFDMATKKDLRDVIDEYLGDTTKAPPRFAGGKNKNWTAKSYRRLTYKQAYQTRVAVAANKALLQAILAAVKSIAKMVEAIGKKVVSPEAMTQAAKDGAAEAFSEKVDDAKLVLQINQDTDEAVAEGDEA